MTLDEADTAAGQSRSEAEAFMDDFLIHSHPSPVLVLGVDISHMSRQYQFFVCATGVFGFSLLYGYLQELISVSLCGRQLGLFLALAQFSVYTFCSYILRTYVKEKSEKRMHGGKEVPWSMYIGLSILRAGDLCMTNLAMQYINYPAKTLMKSARVVFTMLFGVLVARKKYSVTDYITVFVMVAGLAIFMHADANSSAVFHFMGVVLLTGALMCDGAISNMSEHVMNQYGVGQDEFIFKLYSIALVVIFAAATLKGDLHAGIEFMTAPGTLEEINGKLTPTWSVFSKAMAFLIFATVGFLGSSCSAAITKNFGALTMSITSTARKATTLFLSFALFKNECNFEHVLGILLFIGALIKKSFRKTTWPPRKSKSALSIDDGGDDGSPRVSLGL
eukprot:CAMPEP_0118691070 /NCGR_PEP_ID=MMETSP0800-20121206/10473_1 /TAXON_ID=210618 ORGANISM="Striatella unipunctata, Strain CCMP2910" /NCGR_SAMPLE_ID=MMETSP0800 /ASSEMBLY_ACC=CAM_ASM_000638 /LENGTH=390 /DNA_ID=CAMNT_0006588803 /DNA_START=179 /DNA_END=1352 /DNA_ORIENTATION=-